LHALATPGVLLAGSNAGFALATPVGLAVAAVFAAVSSIELSTGRALALMRHALPLQLALLAAMAAWAALSLVPGAPLAGAAPPERASGPLVVIAGAGLLLYAVAVVRYLRLPRHPASPLPLAMAAAFTLLAEAELAVAWGRNWHATWWEWHLLMLTAFVVVAVSAQRQWYDERFAGLYLQGTAAGTREISVLFADLQGFTSFSERHEPQQVTAMLNEYFGSAVPAVVERHGGVVDRLVGDAVMATFNTRGDQPDHALRAARAALDLQRATAGIADAHPGWPRFRVGVNSGEAAIGILGTAGGRTFTVIGDTVNLAARLEGTAPVGGVAVGAETLRRLPRARTEPLGSVTVKGKADPVEVFRLIEA
jgi:class 3 adenylate cyclase